MKYIIVNIKNFIKQETTIFMLAILCIFSSAVIVNFAFGFYHHLEQKKSDENTGIDYFSINFADESKSLVAKGDVMNILLDFDEKVIKNCSIGVNLRYEQYNAEEEMVDKFLVSYAVFSIRDGKVTVSTMAGESWKKNHVLEGEYFTAEQIENGEYVCITEPADIYDGREEGRKWEDTFSPDSEGYCIIDGKKYKAIGEYEFAPYIAVIPITTVDDDCFVQEIIFSFDKPVTRAQYNAISVAFRNAYGDIAVIDDLEIEDLDSQQFYNVLLVLTVLLALLAAVVLSMLYEYIILQRKKNLTIYRLCGINRWKATLMYFSECLLLTAVIYGVGVLIYDRLILPYLSDIFEYMAESYSVKVYLVLGMLYTVTVLCVLFVIIRRQIQCNIVDELKGIKSPVNMKKRLIAVLGVCIFVVAAVTGYMIISDEDDFSYADAEIAAGDFMGAFAQLNTLEAGNYTLPALKEYLEQSNQDLDNYFDILIMDLRGPKYSMNALNYEIGAATEYDGESFYEEYEANLKSMPSYVKPEAFANVDVKLNYEGQTSGISLHFAYCGDQFYFYNLDASEFSMELDDEISTYIDDSIKNNQLVITDEPEGTREKTDNYSCVVPDGWKVMGNLEVIFFKEADVDVNILSEDSIFSDMEEVDLRWRLEGGHGFEEVTEIGTLITGNYLSYYWKTKMIDDDTARLQTHFIFENGDDRYRVVILAPEGETEYYQQALEIAASE